MKLIPLSQKGKKQKGKYFAKVDDEDYEYLNQWKWFALLNRNSWYASRDDFEGEKRVRIFMHRAILESRPNGKMINHKDRNGLNNQRSNLRTCTNSQSQMNKRASGTSKYLGVSFHKQINKYKIKDGTNKVSVSTGWLAHIKVSGKYKHIGLFQIESEAAIAYNNMAKVHHGEFANLNVV